MTQKDTEALVYNQNQLKNKNLKQIEDYNSEINSINIAIQSYEENITRFKIDREVIEANLKLLELSNKGIDETIEIIKNEN